MGYTIEKIVRLQNNLGGCRRLFTSTGYEKRDGLSTSCIILVTNERAFLAHVGMIASLNDVEEPWKTVIFKIIESMCIHTHLLNLPKHWEMMVC